MSLFRRIKTSFRALFPAVIPARNGYFAPRRSASAPVGSIHMGTQDMSPLPSGLLSLLKQADALVVEADISGHESPFAGLESDLTSPTVWTRLSSPN